MRQRIDQPQVGSEQLCRPAAVLAVAVIKDIAASFCSVLPFRRGVAVHGHIQAIGPRVGLADGRGSRLVGVIAGVADAAGDQVRDDLVAQQVHILLFRPAVDIIVSFLRRGAEKDPGHNAPPFQMFSLYLMHKKNGASRRTLRKAQEILQKRCSIAAVWHRTALPWGASRPSPRPLISPAALAQDMASAAQELTFPQSVKALRSALAVTL